MQKRESTDDKQRDATSSNADAIESLNKALAASQARMRQILTSFPFGLVVVSQDRIQTLNKQAQHLFGYTPEELSGKHISTLFPNLDSLKAGSKPLETAAQRKNQEHFASEIVVSEMDTADDSSLFVHVQDVTERHQLEQLKQSFISMVSHDIRTPLTTIKLFLDLLEEGTFGDLTGKGPNQVQRAQTCVKYLVSMVTTLLDSEKIESGTVVLVYSETTVARVVQNAILNCEGAAHGKGITLETEITNDAFRADEDRVIQVLINLIANAIKFSPSQSRVKVVGGLDGLSIKFDVIDEGPGIPKSMQSAIFDRYRQIQNSTGTTPGFGLGLAICKALIEMHNGSISLVSQTGKGSTFSFSIPMDR